MAESWTPKSRRSFDEIDLEQASSGITFGPNTPRLPHGNMLMFDRITEISDQEGKYGKGYIVAELDIRPDLWFFKCHFKEDPVMPGCLGLDSMWQLLGFFLGWCGFKGKGRALGVGEVKFFGQVLPTAKLVTYRIDVQRVISRKLALAIGDGAMYVDNREIYTAKSLRVGLFEDTNSF